MPNQKIILPVILAIAATCAVAFGLQSLLFQPQHNPQPQTPSSSMPHQTFTVAGMGKAGPYSHAVRANGFLFLSGVIPINYDTGEPDTATIADATHRVFTNIKRILAHTGGSLDQVVKATVFLSDMAHYGPMNEVYSTYFPTNPPARSCVAVRELPLGMPVEIEVVICETPVASGQ